ncbi:hypothetical protein S40285_09799 [Stachybotrys chlorohalonatus IBT 40285]|uniref:Uncharacterized protein n=1 Tax=Stachybotrys chlorohalonatus (strain IBT 40285) TaxID=1283841 RepID=A0A084QNY8_STAC4|nr:hypothetical protein S40285_09799 [Stachybotrys chlorohalonata IBT 40285]
MYLNHAKITKKRAHESNKKEVYYYYECAAGKYKQELFIINGMSGVRSHLEQKHQIDP